MILSKLNFFQNFMFNGTRELMETLINWTIKENFYFTWKFLKRASFTFNNS